MKEHNRNQPLANMDNRTLVSKMYASLLQDARQIIETAQRQAYSSINVWLVWRNWHLGKRIQNEDLHGEKRAEYGAKVIVKLAADLTNIYGKGFDFSSLYKYIRFYNAFPEILDSVSPKSNKLLSWTHYRILLQVDDADARA